MKNSSSLIQTKWLNIKASDDDDASVDDDLKSVGPKLTVVRAGRARGRAERAEMNGSRQAQCATWVVQQQQQQQVGQTTTSAPKTPSGLWRIQNGMAWSMEWFTLALSLGPSNELPFRVVSQCLQLNSQLDSESQISRKFDSVSINIHDLCRISSTLTIQNVSFKLLKYVYCYR